MFKFSHILPFSSIEFYYFILSSIVLVYLVKLFFSKYLSYKYVLLFINFCYIILLYPKPIQLLVFILFAYSIFRFFGVKMQKTGIFPILVTILPLFLMKSLVLTKNSGLDISTFELIFQLAGISYASFKMVQIYIDEKNNEKAKDFVNYFNFISFTPTLLIGPIDRFSRFQNNIEQAYASINKTNLEKGLEFILKGIVFKYLFAYAINSYIIIHLVDNHTFRYHLTYMYSYLFYLFFDFAGYSLLAMGFSYLIGIQIPRNFKLPFLARNPKEFWQNWHISLGDWLNDYFFKPIFKELTSKKIASPIQRQSIALFLTFQLMGFWNGFELNYILSGGIFGIYSLIHNYYAYLCKKNQREVLFVNLNEKTISVLSIFFMFNAVAFSIYIFSGKLI